MTPEQLEPGDAPRVRKMLAGWILDIAHEPSARAVAIGLLYVGDCIQRLADEIRR
jgi:hypothetical protein